MQNLQMIELQMLCFVNQTKQKKGINIDNENQITIQNSPVDMEQKYSGYHNLNPSIYIYIYIYIYAPAARKNN